jgi:Ca-activated chloride channel family protein
MAVNILMLATKMGATLTLENGELLKDELEEIVVSRENDAIELIAKKSGGVYTKDVDEILSALESQRDAVHVSEVTLAQNKELFYYFVAFALVVFLLSSTSLKRRVLTLLLLFGVSMEADVLERFKDKNAVAFTNGVALYKAGEYEKSLERFLQVKSPNAEVKAVVFYNIGNSLARLKEFEKAREAYEKSLTLHYSKEADENLRYIRDVKKQKDMSTGRQKSKNRSASAKQRDSSQKNKEGGSSNMKVSASSGSGGQNEGKKTQSSPQIDLNSGKAKLSSKQYELINKRQIDEKKPY